MQGRSSIRISLPTGMALGGGSIVASGAIPSDPRIADALATREDFFAVGTDLWIAMGTIAAEARRDEQGSLFEPESV